MVVADGVRQHDRVDVAVCQTERPAEHVADPVVHRHAHDPERRAGEIRAVERLAARVEVGGPLHRRRDPASERADPFLRHQRRDGVRVLGVQRFDAVRHGVQPARARHERRERGRERGVVEHRARKHADVVRGPLLSVGRDAVDRGHLRPRVRGRDRDQWQSRLEGDDLAEAGGGSAADRHRAIGVRVSGGLPRLLDDLDRHVLLDVGELRDRPRPELFDEFMADVLDRDVVEHDGARDIEAVDLVGQTVDAPHPEHDPAGERVVGEGPHPSGVDASRPSAESHG